MFTQTQSDFRKRMNSVDVTESAGGHDILTRKCPAHAVADAVTTKTFSLMDSGFSQALLHGMTGNSLVR